MQIFVRGPAKLMALTVQNDDTIQDIYECIAEKSGCDMNDFVLSLHGTPLLHEQLFQEIDLVPGTVFDLNGKVLGGKTHGRIGLAGKVRRDTPKVPPQEKPKKKTGRARRREQYAQRFTNKVAAPFDRRGPNANY